MKRIVEIGLVILIVFVAGCKEEESIAVKPFYYLNIESDWKRFYSDKHGCTKVFLEESVQAGDSIFFGEEKIKNAVKFSKKVGLKNAMVLHTAIFAETVDRKFEKIMDFQDFLPLDSSISAGYLMTKNNCRLDDGMIIYKGNLESCLKVVVYEKDMGEGFTETILTFVYIDDEWLLVKREIISTNQTEKSTYCFDTINRNVDPLSAKMVNITRTMVNELSDPNCR
ncbi:hypothetical protein [Flavobacterium sp.]|uniref:hypothetical protein n=1 Tax=Flavobacterium sp. TaxID=239 RepID=UPI00122A4E20|nr:hypothetical protein [Flavobacterium sp.]RZJ71541.1 MAG: hypothetical protein EOO49_09280 [Flavobacterium sp.]